MRPERGLGVVNHCLEWDKFVLPLLRTRLPTPIIPNSRLFSG